MSFLYEITVNILCFWHIPRRLALRHLLGLSVNMSNITNLLQLKQHLVPLGVQSGVGPDATVRRHVPRRTTLCHFLRHIGSSIDIIQFEY